MFAAYSYLFITFSGGPPQKRLWGDPTFRICAMFTAATRRVRSGVLHWGVAASHSTAKTLFGRDPRSFISAIFSAASAPLPPLPDLYTVALLCESRATCHSSTPRHPRQAAGIGKKKEGTGRRRKERQRRKRRRVMQDAGKFSTGIDTS